MRYPDRRLKQAAVPVGTPGAATRRLARALRATAAAHPGTVGLAAPQIGELWRVAYVDCRGHRKAPDAEGELWLIDPVVVSTEGAELGREGCLSLPDVTANVQRARRVVVDATSLEGCRRRLRAEGFEARVILHEIDHLDGVLILDRVASLSLDLFPRRRRESR